MIKEKESQYEDVEILKKIFLQTLKGRKFRLDCGHHLTIGHQFGNDVTIYNGKKLKIICSQCGY